MVLIAVGPVHSEVRLVHYGTRLLARFSDVCPRLCSFVLAFGSLAALCRDLVWIANVLLQLSWCGSSQPCIHVPRAFPTHSEAHPRVHPRCLRVAGARATAGRVRVGRWQGLGGRWPVRVQGASLCKRKGDSALVIPKRTFAAYKIPHPG